MTQAPRRKLSRNPTTTSMAPSGSDLLIRTFGQIWLAAPSSTSVSLTRTEPLGLSSFRPDPYDSSTVWSQGIYRLHSPSPVCITSGVEEDNVSCVQYPIGTWFAGPSFGQTALTSWHPGTTVTTSFEGTTQTSLLPMLGSSATRTTIAQNAFAEGKTEWKPIVAQSNGPYLLTTDGNSGNFGLEQYPSTTLGGSGLSFVVISGKVFSGFSRGHFRRLAIVGVQDGAEVTMLTGTSSQQFSLNTAQAKVIRIDAGSVPIRLTSTKPVQLFDLGEEPREGIAVALPLADSSVTANVTKASSSIPVVSAGTDEASSVDTAAEPPSSGFWQTAWVWTQKATRSVGIWIQKAARSTETFFVSLYTSMRDFFVSGQALRILQTATQNTMTLPSGVYASLCADLAILLRIAPGASMTSELVAVWIFWTIVLLALLILILVLRPRHYASKRLPRVTPRVPGQERTPSNSALSNRGRSPQLLHHWINWHELARSKKCPHTGGGVQTGAHPGVSPCTTRVIVGPEISLEPLGFLVRQRLHRTHRRVLLRWLLLP